MSSVSIGSLWLNLQRKYGKGLRVAYARDFVRPRIFKTAPIETPDSGSVELHVLTSKGDWMNLVWSLKTFFHCSEFRMPICIHEDGSLPDEAKNLIRAHFPQARLLEKPDADKQIESKIKDFPRIRAFRERHPLAIKVFDFSFFLKSERMFLFDSDLIFYSRPDVLIERLQDPDYQKNSVNEDIDTAYNMSFEDAKKLYAVELIPRFNSGLGLIHASSMNWDWFEEWLGYPGIFEHHWRTEQTLFAMASSKFGVELLPKEYQVYRGPRLKDRSVRHYVGEIRHLMYKEGMLEHSQIGLLQM